MTLRHSDDLDHFRTWVLSESSSSNKISLCALFCSFLFNGYV